MSSLQRALANEQRKNPPTVTTADESSSSDDDSSSSDDDSSVESSETPQQQKDKAMKIRQQAINLLNKPISPSQQHKPTFKSPYQQQQSAGERSSHASLGTPSNTNQFSSYQSSSPYAMHDPLAHPRARTAEPLTMKDMVVNCVSEVCKSSSSELIQKVLGAGYKSMSNYENPPVTGTWGPSIDTSQHGYGNNNSSSSSSHRPAAYGETTSFASKYQD